MAACQHLSGGVAPYGAFGHLALYPSHLSHTSHSLHPRAPTIFSAKESSGSPALLSFLALLLLLSGDIETNPGPSYPCPTCTRPYTRRTGGIECSGCGSWTHYTKRCSGIIQNRPIPQGWVCFTCSPLHNLTQNTPSNNPSPNTLQPTTQSPPLTPTHTTPPHSPTTSTPPSSPTQSIIRTQTPNSPTIPTHYSLPTDHIPTQPRPYTHTHSNH